MPLTFHYEYGIQTNLVFACRPGIVEVGRMRGKAASLAAAAAAACTAAACTAAAAAAACTNLLRLKGKPILVLV